MPYGYTQAEKNLFASKRYYVAILTEFHFQGSKQFFTNWRIPLRLATQTSDGIKRYSAHGDMLGRTKLPQVSNLNPKAYVTYELSGANPTLLALVQSSQNYHNAIVAEHHQKYNLDLVPIGPPSQEYVGRIQQIFVQSSYNDESKIQIKTSHILGDQNQVNGRSTNINSQRDAGFENDLGFSEAAGPTRAILWRPEST